MSPEFTPKAYEPTSEEEKKFLENYSMKNYDRPSVTGDAAALKIAAEAGEPTLSLLLIKRGGFPYRGCWALPGGFLQRNETVEECARRELEEETCLKVQTLLPLGCFSTPGRDPRGWIISHPYLAILSEEESKNKPAAGDDASAACWFRVNYTIENEKISVNLTSAQERISEVLKFECPFPAHPPVFQRIHEEGARLAFDHAEMIAAALLLWENLRTSNQFQLEK